MLLLWQVVGNFLVCCLKTVNIRAIPKCTIKNSNVAQISQYTINLHSIIFSYKCIASLSIFQNIIPEMFFQTTIMSKLERTLNCLNFFPSVIILLTEQTLSQMFSYDINYFRFCPVSEATRVSDSHNGSRCSMDIWKWGLAINKDKDSLEQTQRGQGEKVFRIWHRKRSGSWEKHGIFTHSSGHTSTFDNVSSCIRWYSEFWHDCTDPDLYFYRYDDGLLPVLQTFQKEQKVQITAQT